MWKQKFQFFNHITIAFLFFIIEGFSSIRHGQQDGLNPEGDHQDYFVMRPYKKLWTQKTRYFSSTGFGYCDDYTEQRKKMSQIFNTTSQDWRQIDCYVVIDLSFGTGVQFQEFNTFFSCSGKKNWLINRNVSIVPTFARGHSVFVWF